MRTEAMERVMIYGTGECGGRIADGYKRNGWDAVAYNSAKADMENLKHITDKRLIGNTEGSGRDRRISRKSFLANINNIKTSIIADMVGKELAIIKVGVAGGTGSGIALPLAELLLQQGKKVVVDAVKPSREEMQGISRKNYLEFISEAEKIKNDITIRFWDNELEYSKINEYNFKADDMLFHPQGTSYITSDFRDILKNLKKGYCLIEHGTTAPVLNDDLLNIETAKYSTFITQDVDRRDGYEYLNKYNLGSLDKKHYQYIVAEKEQEAWLLMLCGLELKPSITELIEGVKADVMEMNKKAEVLAFSVPELED